MAPYEVSFGSTVGRPKLAGTARCASVPDPLFAVGWFSAVSAGGPKVGMLPCRATSGGCCGRPGGGPRKTPALYYLKSSKSSGAMVGASFLCFCIVFAKAFLACSSCCAASTDSVARRS